MKLTDEQALAIRSLGRPFAPKWFKDTFEKIWITGQ